MCNWRDPTRRASAIGMMLATSLQAQLLTYDDVQKARERADAAEQRFLLGALAVIVLGLTLGLRSLLHYRRKIKPGMVPDAAAKPPMVWLSVVLRVLAMVFRVLAVVVAVSYFVSCARASNSSNTIPVQYAFFTMISLGWVGSLCAQQASRLRTPLADDALAADPRPPIIFFRSFSEEEFSLSRNDQWWIESDVPALLEEAVLTQFCKIGPVIGLTNPRLGRRPGTYSPYDATSGEWQAGAESLIERAAAIVVVLSQSAGVDWEIQRLREKERLSRTLFVLPPLEPDARHQRTQYLLAKLGLAPGTLVKRVQASDFGEPQELALIVSDSDVMVYLDRPDAGGYALVVQRALQHFGLGATNR